MTLRRISIVALLLALGGTVAWVGLKRGPAPLSGALSPSSPQGQADASGGVPPSAVVTSSVAPGTPLVRTAATPTETSPAAVAAAHVDAGATAAAGAPRGSEGRTELESVRFMLRDFRTRLGENPVGSNAEIMRAVMGGNAAGARLGPPEGQSLNAEGELTDRWGTPYFFHQLSRESMEIRSAGPDQRMWTADDLVTK